jgi:hypothetical protein
MSRSSGSSDEDGRVGALAAVMDLKEKAGIVPAFKSNPGGGDRGLRPQPADQKPQPIVTPSTRGRNGISASMNWAEEVNTLACELLRFVP